MLKDGPVTSTEFVQRGILRYSARIHELRNAGYDIWASPIEGSNVWLYELNEHH
jgi:hypothetical protein